MTADRAPLTMIVGAVHHVGVAFSQVGEEEAEDGAVAGQRRQVDGAAAVFVQQAGVPARPQEHLHHPGLASDHGQVERRLQTGVRPSATCTCCRVARGASTCSR